MYTYLSESNFIHYHNSSINTLNFMINGMSATSHPTKMTCRANTNNHQYIDGKCRDSLYILQTGHCHLKYPKYLL